MFQSFDVDKVKEQLGLFMINTSPRNSNTVPLLQQDKAEDREREREKEKEKLTTFSQFSKINEMNSEVGGISARISRVGESIAKFHTSRATKMESIFEVGTEKVEQLKL